MARKEPARRDEDIVTCIMFLSTPENYQKGFKTKGIADGTGVSTQRAKVALDYVYENEQLREFYHLWRSPATGSRTQYTYKVTRKAFTRTRKRVALATSKTSMAKITPPCEVVEEIQAAADEYAKVSTVWEDAIRAEGREEILKRLEPHLTAILDVLTEPRLTKNPI